jgi:DNA-binding response OmpR family regulator
MDLKLLIVEDDIELQKVLSNLLQSEGFIVEVASTGSAALRKIEKIIPDLILLDLGLPDIQGETVLQTVRKDFPEIPVVILTAKSNPHDIAKGLNLGADDYLPKPFAVEELLARIKARLKRTTYDNNNHRVGDLVLNKDKMVAKRAGNNINLTKTEFDLLSFLITNKGKVLSRSVILNHVWGFSSDVESRVVDVYIGYLRNKIDDGFKNKLIKNKRGFGYFIDA